MKIIKNCVVISFLLVIIAGCVAKVNPSSGATSNPSSSNSGSGGPVLPPPATDWRTKTVDEVKSFKDDDGKNLFQLSIGNPQELKELIQKVGAAKAIEMAVEGDKPYVTGELDIVTTKSPIRMAIETDNEDALNALLEIPGIEAELDKNINDNYIHNPLLPQFVTVKDSTLVHVAAREGKVNTFKALIKKAPKLLNKIDRDGNNPLFDAVKQNQENIIKAFLDSTDITDTDKKALLQKTNHQYMTIALMAADNGTETIFKALIKKFPELINQTNNISENVAHLAARNGHSSIIKLLSKEILTKETVYKNTVADLAAKNGNLDVLQALHEADPNIFNQHNSEGFSPLHYSESKEAAKFILDNTAKEVVQSCQNNTSVLHNAISYSNTGLFEALIEDKSGKVDLGLLCEGVAPVHNTIASEPFKLDNNILQPFIIALNADQINAKNSSGHTALHSAAMLNPSQIALLAQNPHLDVNILNNNGYSALDIAISYAPSYQYELELTAEQKTKPSNNKFINFMRLQDQDNTQNRDEAVDALLQINNLSEKTITDGAIMAAGNADTINLKKLLDTKKVKFSEEIEPSKGINANKLVWSCLYFIFVDLTKINKLNNISDKNGNRWDADVYYKTKITKAVIDNLQALKDAGMPPAAFSNNILNIQWADLVQSEMLGMFTWHFKEVQDKLKELAK